MPEYATATGNDYPEHERTYASVVKLAKIGIGTSVVGLVSMTVGLVAGHAWVMIIGLALTLVSMVVGFASERGRVGPLVGTLVVVLFLWAIVS